MREGGSQLSELMDKQVFFGVGDEHGQHTIFQIKWKDRQTDKQTGLKTGQRKVSKLQVLI